MSAGHGGLSEAVHRGTLVISQRAFQSEQQYELDASGIGTTHASDAGLPAPEATPVVVVDDEPSVLDLLAKILTREGYPVETFVSAPDALTRVTDGGVALLITDI